MKQVDLWNDLYSKNPITWRGNTVIPVPNSGKALDLGCGNGKTVSTLLDDGYDVTGVDFSEVAIGSCRKSFPNSDFRVSSVTELPFGDCEFDYVTAVHVLEHLDDESLGRTVSEIGRVLKSGGYVFIRAFTENDMRSKDRAKGEIFYRFYDIPSLQKAFDGFETVSAELKEDRTRFGTTRSRVELLVKKL